MANAKTASSVTRPQRRRRIKSVDFAEKESGRKVTGSAGANEGNVMSFDRTFLETLAAGITESRRSGCATRFVVEVLPSGRLRVFEGAQPSGEYPNAAAADNDELHEALKAARARGRSRAAEILQRKEMLGADQFAQLLGVSRVTVNAKRQKHEVLALDGAKRGFRFPAWQLDENGKPFAAIPKLFERLGDSAWAVYRFLVQRHPELDGLSAIEALRRGDSERVIETAEGVARGTFA
jgi:hypothetical protein